jgi:cobalt-zinc-cadmium efflux system protein
MVLLERALKEIPGVIAVHDLHVWTITSGRDSMSCHLVIADMARARETLLAANNAMKTSFNLAHTTIQVEDQALRDGEAQAKH